MYSYGRNWSKRLESKNCFRMNFLKISLAFNSFQFGAFRRWCNTAANNLIFLLVSFSVGCELFSVLYWLLQCVCRTLIQIPAFVYSLLRLVLLVLLLFNSFFLLYCLIKQLSSRSLFLWNDIFQFFFIVHIFCFFLRLDSVRFSLRVAYSPLWKIQGKYSICFDSLMFHWWWCWLPSFAGASRINLDFS